MTTHPSIRYIVIPNIHHFSLIENMVNSGDPFTNLGRDPHGLEGPIKFMQH
jgi:hypothetical protein